MKLFLVILATIGLTAAAPTPKALADDLADLLALIPQEEIKVIFQTYAETDPDVQQVVRYLQSAEFDALLLEIGANPEYQALKAELIAAGVDVDAIVSYLRDYISGVVVPPKAGGHRSIQAMLDEILAIIPLGDIVVLLNDKLTNSPEFIAFWERLTSLDTYNLVEQLRALPEVQRLDEVLLGLGIDLTAMLMTVYEFFGWPTTATFALQDDLNELLALIPVDEIVAIIQKYADTDPDVQRIVLYLQGPEWHALVDAVRANPDYQALKAQLIAAGIDVDAIIDSIHNLVAGIVVPGKVSPSGRSVQAMLDEITAIIPLADIIVLLNDKLTNSPEFIAFWETVTSMETYALVEQVRALDEVQRLAAVLLEMGVDATAILNTVYEFLGWPVTRA